jgi:SAM-dependent methyltransferase
MYYFLKCVTGKGEIPMESAFEALTKKQAEVWNSAPFEHIADNAADIDEDLIWRLSAHPGVRWLDIATGTGVVALCAARKGADVTAQDIASRMIETARRLARAEGLDITLEVGDCQKLPYPDGSFDVVSSVMGAVFAPDHDAVAHELGRVCRPGGRLGLVSWRSGGDIGKFYGLTARFNPPPSAGVDSPFDWGKQAYVQEKLGKDFTLEFHEGVSPMYGASPEAFSDLFLTSFGPIKALNDRLDDGQRGELHEALIGFFKDYQQPDGTVSVPREYLIAIGTRRNTRG